MNKQDLSPLHNELLNFMSKTTITLNTNDLSFENTDNTIDECLTTNREFSQIKNQ